MKIVIFFLRVVSVLLCVACSDSDSSSLDVDKEFIKFVHKNEIINFVPFDFTAVNDQGKLYLFDHDLALENLSLNTKFEILTDDPIVISTGTDLGGIKIYNNYFEIFKSSSDFKSTVLNERVEFLNPLKKNVTYQMGFIKTSEGINFYIKSDSTSISKFYSKNVDFNQCVMRGKPYFNIFKGSFRVLESILTSDYENKPKISVYGDSFIEGSSLFVNKFSLENRWCAKLSSKEGINNCLIDGKGGDKSSQTFIDRFKIENSWFKSKYVILSVGTNNNEPDEYINNIKKVIEILKSNNQIPILVTVTPRFGFDFFKSGDIINKWILSSGENYVDMNKAVTIENDRATWKKGFVLSDQIHPTPSAYVAMFDQLKNDCPYLF